MIIEVLIWLINVISLIFKFVWYKSSDFKLIKSVAGRNLETFAKNHCNGKHYFFYKNSNLNKNFKAILI